MAPDAGEGRGGIRGVAKTSPTHPMSQRRKIGLQGLLCKNKKDVINDWRRVGFMLWGEWKQSQTEGVKIKCPWQGCSKPL